MPYTRPFLLHPVSPSFRHFSLNLGGFGGWIRGVGFGGWWRCVAPTQFFFIVEGFWEVKRASGEGGEQRVLLEGRG